MKVKKVAHFYPKLPLDNVFHLYTGYQDNKRKEASLPSELKTVMKSIPYNEFIKGTILIEKHGYFRLKKILDQDLKKWPGVISKWNFAGSWGSHVQKFGDLFQHNLVTAWIFNRKSWILLMKWINMNPVYGES